MENKGKTNKTKKETRKPNEITTKKQKYPRKPSKKKKTLRTKPSGTQPMKPKELDRQRMKEIQSKMGWPNSYM